MTTPRHRATATPLPTGTGDDISMTVVGNTATATGCQSGKRYRVAVTALGDGITTTDSEPALLNLSTLPNGDAHVVDPGVAPKPRRLRNASEPSDTGFIIEWDAAAGPGPYTYQADAVELNTGHTTVPLTGTVTGLRATFTGARPLTRYKVRIVTVSATASSLPETHEVKTTAPISVEAQLDDLYSRLTSGPRDSTKTIDAQLAELETVMGITDIAGKTHQERLTALYKDL